MKPWWPCLAGCACALAAGLAAAGDLVLTTEESPPYNMHDRQGKLVGIAVDKLTEMLERATVRYRIKVLPWARAYQMALSQPDTCVFSTARTAERESSFHWVGPLAYNTWILYGLAARHFNLKTLEDARALRIGTYNADVRDAYLRERHFNVDTASSDSVNPRKLLLGRVDLWATNAYKARTELAANGWTDIIVPVLTFKRIELYLACNPKVPVEDVDRMSVALQSMDSDGTSMAIERRYENWPN